MASGDAKGGVQRRLFLKGAAAASAAAVGTSLLPTTGAAASITPSEPGRVTTPPATAKLEMVSRPGSDFMVDVLKALSIDYVVSNPGSSFRSFQESIINY